MGCHEGWECEDCMYNKGHCTYTEEEMNLQQIAEEVEKRDYKETMEQAEVLIKARGREKPEEGTLEWFYSTHPPDYNVKEPINAMSGAIKFGGGSKSGKKHKVVKKSNPFDYLRAES